MKLREICRNWFVAKKVSNSCKLWNVYKETGNINQTIPVHLPILETLLTV